MIYPVKVKRQSDLIPVIVGGATGIGSGFLANKFSGSNKTYNALRYGVSGGLAGFGASKLIKDHLDDKKAHDYYEENISPLKKRVNSLESILDKGSRFGFLNESDKLGLREELKTKRDLLKSNEETHLKMPRSSNNSFKIGVGTLAGGLGIPLFT